MEYFQEILKKNGTTSIVTSIAFAILGLILICFANVAIKVVASILGIIIVAFGTFKLINYWKTKGKYDFYNYDIAYGIIAIVIGLIVIGSGSKIAAIFRIVIGVWIIYSAIIRLNLTYKLKTMDVDVWKYSLGIALAILICGILIVAIPNAVIKFIGSVILIYSILDIVEGIIFIKNIDRMF